MNDRDANRWGSFLAGLGGVLLAAVIVIGWREWATWVEVRNFVVPIIRQQQAQQAQPRQQAAPAPAPEPTPSASPAK